MVKAKKTKKTAFTLDAAGWGFWLIMFALLLGPLAWGGWKIGMVKEGVLQYGLLVFVGAAFGAGIIAWLTNTVLQTWSKRQRDNQRKKAKKR